MNKKVVRLLVLLVVLVLLGTGFLILNKKNKDKEEQKLREEEELDYVDEDDTLLYSFDYEDMKQISFVYEEQEYSFTKKDGIWYYDADENFPVHQVHMEAKASKLAEIYVEREIKGTKTSMSDFGLDHPVVTVTLTLESGESHTFLMGDRNDTAGAYYMLDKDTGKYYFRDGSLVVAFADNFNLYDLAEVEGLPSVSMSEITHIYINGNENLNMELTAKVASLELAKGVNYNASDADMESYGLTNPRATLKVVYNKTLNSLTTEKTYTLLIGNATEDETVYVCVEGSREVAAMDASKLSFVFE